MSPSWTQASFHSERTSRQRRFMGTNIATSRGWSRCVKFSGRKMNLQEILILRSRYGTVSYQILVGTLSEKLSAYCNYTVQVPVPYGTVFHVPYKAKNRHVVCSWQSSVSTGERCAAKLSPISTLISSAGSVWI